MGNLMCFICLLLLGFSSVLSAQSTDHEQFLLSVPDWSERKMQAIQKFAGQDYDETIRLLKYFPEEDTAWATANFFYVSANVAGSHNQEAVHAAWKGLEITPSPYRRSLFDLLGSVYAEEGKYDSAIVVFQNGLKEFPHYYRYHFGLGLAYKGLKEYTNSIQCFQYAVRLNPYHGLTHYYLGVMCMNNNYIVPAMLSFQMQLLVDDPGDRCVSALSMYERMAQGGWSVHKDSLYWQMPDGSNNFQDVEKLVRSKIAMSEKYQSKVTLNYPAVVKQMQLLYEQVQYNAADTGFWMQFYVPFVKQMWEKNHFPAGVYQAFASVNDKEVTRQVKKNLSVITKMAEFARLYWDEQQSAYWLKNNLVDRSPWFNSNGALKSIGTFDEKLKHAVGYWKYFSPGSYSDNEGLYDEYGKEQGKWKYFDLYGRLKSVRTAKDGLLNDTSWSYYPNGVVEEYNIIRNGKINGVSQGYHYSGAVSGKVSFRDDKRDGRFELYHENGFVRQKGAYKMDVPDGPFVEYFDNGVKQEEYIYVNGKLEGRCVTWYDNGQMKSEGSFTAGKSSGAWKYYNRDGKLEREGAFKDGNEEGVWKEYSDAGLTSRQMNYSGGWLDGDAVYYDEGKLWSKIVYNKSEVMSFEYYDKSGKVVSQGKRDSKQMLFRSMYPQGTPMREGVYTNNGMEGKWKRWSPFGVLIEEENYVNGVMDGEQRYFHNTGQLKTIFNYRNGHKNGVAREYYLNGQLFKQTVYNNGEQNGYYFEYYPDGTLSEKYYTIEGTTNGLLTYYDVVGRKSISYGYYLGNVNQVISYDSLGNVLTNEKFPTCNASFKIHGMGRNNPVNSEITYKYGSIDGTLREFYADGKLHSTTVYANGSRNGPRLVYDTGGKVSDAMWYRNGKLDSVRVITVDGKIESERWYRDDEQQGTATWFYPNGKTEITGNYKNDQRDGYFMYYSYNRELRFRLKYSDGFIVSYSYLSADSVFVPEIPLMNGNGAVKSWFRNGKLSAEFTFRNGYYDGVYTLYFPDGKVAKKSQYVSNDSQGAFTEYYPDGKLWKEENYADDEFNGTCRYYYESGKLREQFQYKSGKKHGDSLSYDSTGKLIRKINWYNDETID